MTGFFGTAAEVFEWIARISLESCVPIVLILVIGMLLGKKLSPKWRYLLWILLLVKLILPWSIPSRISAYNLFPAEKTSEALLPIVQKIENVPQLKSSEDSDKNPKAPSHTDAEQQHVSQTARKTEPEKRGHLPETTPKAPAAVVQKIEKTPSNTDTAQQHVSEAARKAEPEERRYPRGRQAVAVVKQSFKRFVPVLSQIWLIGVVMMLGWVFSQRLYLRRIPRQRLLTDQWTMDILENCKVEMGTHAYLAVIETPDVKSPCLLGHIRPRLLLPQGAAKNLSSAQLRHVFMHELAHLKRHDNALNFAMALLLCLHWFNPWVWYAFKRMRIDRELAADEAVLSRVRPEDRPEYGGTIVHLLKNFSKQRRLPMLAGILETQNQAKRRIKMITQFKKLSIQWSVVAVAVVVMLGLVTFTGAIGPTCQANTPNYVLMFDGDNDYCLIPHSEALTFENRAFTVEFWFYSFGVGTWSDVMLTKGKSGDPENSNYSFILQNDGSFEFEWEYDNGTNQESWVNPWTDNVWHHVAGVFDGNDQLLYLDGNLVSHNEDVYGPGVGEDRDIYIGSYDPGGNLPSFYGYLDEIRIWDTARSQQEIEHNMLAALSGTEQGLVGYWDFDEGSATMAYDKTANNNHCILGGDGLGDDIPSWVAIDIPVDDVVLKIKNAITENENIAGKVDVVLDKEWEAYDVLEGMLESGDYGYLSKGDIVKAKQKIHSAMQHQEQALNALDKSIEKLYDALKALGWEPEAIPE